MESNRDSSEPSVPHLTESGDLREMRKQRANQKYQRLMLVVLGILVAIYVAIRVAS
jgi:hypothetical protein